MLTKQRNRDDALHPVWGKFRDIIRDMPPQLPPVIWQLAGVVAVFLVFRKASTAKDLADVIRALAILFWPCIVVTVIAWFRTEIRGVLVRIKKLKGYGVVLILEELRTTVGDAKKVVAERLAVTAAVGKRQHDQGPDAVSIVDYAEPAVAIANEAVAEVRREASTSPIFGLQLLAEELKTAARKRAEYLGLKRRAGPRDQLQMLVAAHGLPREVAEGLDLFSKVHRQITSNHDTDNVEIASAIESGLELLRMLITLPNTMEDLETRTEELILEGRCPPAAWAPFIFHMDLIGTKLHSLSLLAGLTSLQILYLRDTQVEDVSPLSGLSSLQRLDMGNTPVNDVSPLSDLAALQRLDLSGTQVADVSPISDLAHLETLYLSSTQISELPSVFSKLAALRTLDLSATQVSDLSPLSGLINLRRLDLRGTAVKDISPLSGLANLRRLDLRKTAITDTSSLSHLKGLQILKDIQLQNS